MARRAARCRGFYASHIRGEGATLLDAVAEAIRVGREGALPVQVSHIKAAGRPNWGKVADALALIDAARAEGLDVMADVYPYTASSTTLRTALPDWALEGGIDAMLKRLADPGGARPHPRRADRRRRDPAPRARLVETSWWPTARQRPDARGPPDLRDRGGAAAGSARRGHRADRGRAGQGLHDSLPARRGGPAPRAGASGT